MILYFSLKTEGFTIFEHRLGVVFYPVQRNYGDFLSHQHFFMLKLTLTNQAII